MDLDFEIPYKVCLNPPRMEERRRTVSEMFRMHRLRVIRWPSKENGGRRHSRGFANAGLRENYLTFLLAVRKARALGRKALLFLEDDVILHDQFRERAADLEVPSDWGLLYFGCLHMERPEFTGPGLLRVARALDTHAVAVNSRYYKTILHSLRIRRAAAGATASPPLDVALSILHKTIPTYAVWPNLAWQRLGYSYHSGGIYSNYTEDGSQGFMPEVIRGL